MPGEAYDSTKYQGRVYSGVSSGWFNLNAPGAPGRSDSWHKFEIERLPDGTTVNFYVNGTLCRQITGVTEASWDSVTIGSAGAGSTAGDAFFNDISTEYFDAPTIVAQPTNNAVHVGATAHFWFFWNVLVWDEFWVACGGSQSRLYPGFGVRAGDEYWRAD